VPVGSQPYAVAVNPVTNKVYVPNYSSGTVTVIDGATHNTATVPVGSQPYAVAVNPVTNKVYVANLGSGTVTVIDGATNNTATVPVGSTPIAAAVNPVTNKVYVANYNDDTVTVIDGASNTTVAVPVGSNPEAVAVNPVTNKVYVANISGTTVTVIEGATNNTAAVTVGSGPQALAVNPVTNKVYVANFPSTTVTVIDGATNTIATAPVGSTPYAVTVNPVTNQVYVANSGSGTVTVIDGATNTTATVTVGSGPQAVAVNPATNQVYVANYGSNAVTVIDGAGTGGLQTVPLSISTTGPATATDPLTVAVANAILGTPYSTINTAPVLTATVISAYATSSTYSADLAQTRANPPPTALYYQVDGGSGTWSQATMSTAAGSTQATFSIPLTGQTVGLHEVYLYAAYGDEGVSASSGAGSGNSPEISNLAAFPYLVLPVPTATTLRADSNPQEVNGTVTFTATVSSTTGTGAPTGTVSFYDSITGTPVLLGSRSLSVVSGSDIAELQTNFTAGGSHPISAVYSGDTAYAGSTGSQIEIIDTLTLAPATLPSPTIGVAYSETVSASGGTAPYIYSISAGALPAGLTLSPTGVLSGTPTATGTFNFTVTAKDTNGLTTAQAHSFTVAKQASQATVSASPSVASPAQTVTLTAVVSATVAGTSIAPGGTVMFLDNGTQVGTATLSGGTATLVVPSPPAGTTAVITATYAGDGNFLASTSSNSATVVVSAFDFTFTNTGTAAYTAAPGAVATYNFALAPLYGSYAGTVSFSVTGLPAGATASFTPSTEAVGGGATPIVMTVQTAAATARKRNDSSPFGRGIVLALLFLPLLSKRRVREKLRGRMLLLVLLMAGLTATLTGCGSQNGFLLQSPQTVTLTVTATSGTLQHSQIVTLIVQ
jgi:YVTN family beta-propeller protein